MEGLDRVALIVGVYIEPKTKADDFSEIKNLTTDLILAEKAVCNPVIIMGGDLNKRDLGAAVEEYEDIYEIGHGPTRAGEKLDQIFTNIEPENIDARVLPPLQNREGVLSDHACVVVQAGFRRDRKYTWVKKMVRKRTEDGNERFGDLVRNQDWDLFYADANPSEMVQKLHKLIEQWLDICFPLKLVRVRSDEDP